LGVVDRAAGAAKWLNDYFLTTRRI
jgi:hypothetical protein